MEKSGLSFSGRRFSLLTSRGDNDFRGGDAEEVSRKEERESSQRKRSKTKCKTMQKRQVGVERGCKKERGKVSIDRYPLGKLLVAVRSTSKGRETI